MFSVCSTSVIVNFTLFKLVRDDFTHPQRSYWRNSLLFNSILLFVWSYWTRTLLLESLGISESLNVQIKEPVTFGKCRIICFVYLHK